MNYTGHPFTDVGIAVLENILEKPCEKFDDSDFEQCAEELEQIYEREIMKGYLTIHFPNSGWCNFTIGKEKKEEYIKSVLHSRKVNPLTPGRRCAFCGEEAVFLADRRHVPLLTGETAINCAPAGKEPGLPVCGSCLYAVQFYPLGTLKVDGKPLFWWSAEPCWIRLLVGNTYRKVRKVLELKLDKFPNFNWPRTRLLQSAEEVMETIESEPNIDLIGYHTTNYGSGPDYKTYQLPKALLMFLRDIGSASEDVRRAHRWVIKSNWEKAKEGKAEKEIGKVIENYGRNRYYEALAATGQDPIGKGYYIIHDFYLHRKGDAVNHNNFGLCANFLEKVIGVERERLELIRKMADIIVENLILKEDKKWLKELYYKSLGVHRFFRYIVRVQKSLSDVGQALTYEEVLRILNMDNEDDTLSGDLWLVQDLLLIRMLEVVGRQNKELISELEEAQENENEIEEVGA